MSVIIPAYNVASYILESVQSALGQSLKDMEVIVVEGGSSDGTAERLGEIRDGRLRIVPQPRPGLSAARNTGVRASTGAYIGFLDGDDAWLPGLAQRHLEYLERHPDADLTFSLSLTIGSDGHEIGLAVRRPAGAVSFNELFAANPVGNASAVVLRRDSIERAGMFDTSLAAFEDIDLWLRVSLLRPQNVHCIPEVLTLYRRRPGQLSADWRRIEKEWEKLQSKMLLLAPAETRRLQSAACCGRYRYYAFLAYENGRYAEAMRLLAAGLRQAPFRLLADAPAWMLLATCLAGMILPRAAHRKIVECGAHAQRRLCSKIRK